MKNQSKDSLGDRMKRYEAVSKTTLVQRMPVILRLDGCHFHTFTKGFEKPFDMVMMKSMQDTMKYLCKNIQGCVFGYTQSDEITLVLVDYKNLNSSQWFDNEVQKMCSVAASMAAYAFNKYFASNVIDYEDFVREHVKDENYLDLVKLKTNYQCAIMKGAYFDCRAFNVPKEDVCNCIIWRQQDAVRNSIQSLAQANFSHKALQGLSCNMLQDKLMVEKGINWNDLDTVKKRGSACIKKYYTENGKMRSNWVIDYNMPILTQDKNYVEQFVIFEDED